ncbi:MAG: hypothetical protein WBX38_21750, partial [Candidatus Sulfotelmatobacter sp.]
MKLCFGAARHPVPILLLIVGTQNAQLSGRNYTTTWDRSIALTHSLGHLLGHPQNFGADFGSRDFLTSQ